MSFIRRSKAKSKTPTSASKKKSSTAEQPERGLRLWAWLTGAGILIGLGLLAAVYISYLDMSIREQFEGKRWTLPARVYARPLELFPGAAVRPRDLAAELDLLGYRSNIDGNRPGSYIRNGNEFEIISRPFKFWDGSEAAVHFTARFDDQSLVEIKDNGAQDLALVRLDPFQFATISPAHNEDRVLVQLREVPPLLIQALTAVEDRNFFTHYGVDPKGLARALWANVTAGKVVQGGSTLTQQLVKNFFLTSARTLDRKAKEALMAMLLEWHYDKNAILEAYCNEIYLGQDGRRAIHGFGLASQFYFGNSLQELQIPEVALLIGLVRGPSYYDPRRYPDRAKARRNQVIQILAAQGVISAQEAKAALTAPLGISRRAGASLARFPAFLELVRNQLKQNYREEDLQSEGLQIFTTLDPGTQIGAEKAVAESMAALEKRRGVKTKILETAAIITDTNSGEVLSVIGGRSPDYAGFNRALNSVRQVGSLIKPAVYLTALEQPERYTLLTLLDDSPLTVENRGSKPWTPANYDKQIHGLVPLHDALAQSYNLSTARLGLDLGLPAVLRTIRKLGIERDLPAYPSILLGAVTLTPLEVAQMYQTFAGSGFQTYLRSIREVVSNDGTPLQRYPLNVEQVFNPAAVYLLNIALQEVVNKGTGASLYLKLPPHINVAGKTGTTDDMRDSWFAGFTGDRLAVVWVGRDDNKSSGLTGATGALQVWGDILNTVGARPLVLTPPPEIEWQWVDPESGMLSSEECFNAIRAPFIVGSAPQEYSSCGAERAADLLEERVQEGVDNAQESVQDTVDWFRNLFQ